MPALPVSPSFLQAATPCWPFSAQLPSCTLTTTRFDTTSDSIARIANGLEPVGSNPKRQAEYLAGRSCATRALAKAGHGHYVPERDGNSGRPLWPGGWCGSITHSHGIAAAVVGETSRWQSLGLDMEKMIAPERAQRLRRAILTPDEQHWMEQHDPATAARNLTLIFSAKESLFKTLNPLTNIYFGFQDAQVLPGTQEGQITLQLLRDLAPPHIAGTMFSALWCEYGHGVLTLVSLPVDQHH